MSIKEMDGGTAVKHPGNSINSYDSFGVEKKKKGRKGPRKFSGGHIFVQTEDNNWLLPGYLRPDSLQVIGKCSEILQLNILQIAPVHCLFTGLHMNAFGDLIAMMTINAAVIGISGISYGVHKQMVLRRQKLDSTVKVIKISKTKELVYRNLFFFLHATYLSTCSKTANVLPLACRRLCRDDKEDFCYKYLKADCSMQCQGSNYNYSLIVAYISTAYIIALPVASFVTLWRQQRVIMATENTKTNKDPSVGMEMCSGLHFLFENYKARSWYWELIEMSRKVILTSGLALVGQESRSYIGLTWVVAGMYGVLFAYVRPIQDEFENRLMTTSLAVTVVNLAIGAVSRIPAENIPVSIDPPSETVLFKILVLGANTLVIGLLVGRIILSSIIIKKIMGLSKISCSRGINPEVYTRRTIGLD